MLAEGNYNHPTFIHRIQRWLPLSWSLFSKERQVATQEVFSASSSYAPLPVLLSPADFSVS